MRPLGTITHAILLSITSGARGHNAASTRAGAHNSRSTRGPQPQAPNTPREAVGRRLRAPERRRLGPAAQFQYRHGPRRELGAVGPDLQSPGMHSDPVSIALV